MSKYCFFLVILAFFGCKAVSSELDIKKMERAEKEFNERQGKELVAFMSLETMFPDEQMRALAKAAGNGNVRKVEEMVSRGLDVNSRGRKNATVLFWAMKRKSIKGFKSLLVLGADPNVIFDDGGTVMHWAARNKDTNYLMAALERGGNPNLVAGSMFKETPLFEAITYSDMGNKSSLSILLDAGADINAKNSNGDFPVTVSANLGRFDIVYELLQRGADFRVTNVHGQNLTGLIVSERKLLDPKHERFRWLEQVDVWLKEREAAPQ